jgi:aminoglycoside phosphotransferase (APT) family kinase protein
MPTYANTVPVMERHRFDSVSLDRYLSRHLDGYRGGLEVSQFDSGHSNPTFFVAAEMSASGTTSCCARSRPASWWRQPIRSIASSV